MCMLLLILFFVINLVCTILPEVNYKIQDDILFMVTNMDFLQIWKYVQTDGSTE